MNKIKYFKKKVKELALKTNVENDIVIRQDNRLGRYSACIDIYIYSDNGEHVYLLRYNAKKIVTLSKAEILMIALHELGHIKLQHEFNNDSSLEKLEYEAEKFAMKNIKKYFPKSYSVILRYLGGYRTHDNDIYKRAFTKLYEELINEKKP